MLYMFIMCLNLPFGFCVSSSQVRYSSDIIQLDVIRTVSDLAAGHTESKWQVETHYECIQCKHRDNLYAPWESQEEWELVRWLVDSQVSQDKINRLIPIWVSCINLPFWKLLLTFQN